MDSLRSKIQAIFSKAAVDIKDCLDAEAEDNIEMAFELGYLLRQLETDILGEVEARENDR